MPYTITCDDIKKRVYFIIKLVQSQNGDTMQGALTSKSDSMGGIFDRFINSISDDILFDKFILPKLTTSKNVEFINDFYLYNPSKNQAGIAPDIFGIKVDDRVVPFTQFNEKWQPVENMPQIEIKTFKAKDQMVSLRNQDYDSEYLALADLKLRIDYLLPFFNQELFKIDVLNDMKMNDEKFIINDSKNRIDKVSEIDFSMNEIGLIDLITITSGKDFMNQSTCCNGGIGPRRVKEIKIRKVNVKKTTGKFLSEYCQKSLSLSSLMSFNDEWYTLTKINNKNTKYVDFHASKVDRIEICAINKDSIVVKSNDDECEFNGMILQKDKQYTIEFATLERTGNGGTEYFMQKQCTKYLKSHQDELIKKLNEIIKDC